MAEKRSKSKTKSPPARGVVGFLKNIVRAKPASTRAPKPARAKAEPRTKAVKAKSGRAARSAPKESAPAQPVPVKKKPPSITITRPEVTRPPIVLPPPRELEAPIGAPSILVPKGGLATTSLTPILRWMYVGGATRYEVEWSPDPHFGRGKSVTLVATKTALTLDSPNELKPATHYRWRVRGGNDAGWGPWSQPETFRSPEK